MEQQPATAPIEEETSRRSSLVIQTIPILLIPLGMSLLTFLILGLVDPSTLPERPADLPPPILPVVVLSVFFSALILLIRLRRPTISALALIAGWTLITVLGTLRAGVSANIVALLIIPIVVAGLLIDAVASVSLAALATLLVAAMAWLELSGYIPPAAPLPAFSGPSQPLGTAIFWAGLFWTVAALTSLLSRGLLQALRDSRRRAEELRQLSAQLEARVQAQTAELLAQAAQQATLEERARLAREIHDTIAQGLAGVAVQLGAARQGLGLLGPGPDPALLRNLAENLGLAEQMARETLAEARRSVWNLRAPLLERADLGAALAGVAAQPGLGPPASFRVEGQPWGLPPEAEAALLRVAQEGLANTRKHSGATRAELALIYREAEVALELRDDGAGFPPEVLAGLAAPGPGGGLGLLGMAERLRALGGTLQLSNDGGAHLRAAIPRRTP